MPDLTLDAFLLARIAEDEAVAVAYRDGDNSGNPYAGDGDGSDLAYEERFNPARVLARCAADRTIVELRYSWNLQAEKFTEPPFGPILQTQVNTADAVLRTLARVYAEHPDYREEWKP